MDALEVTQRLCSDNTDDNHNKQGTDAQNCLLYFKYYNNIRSDVWLWDANNPPFRTFQTLKKHYIYQIHIVHKFTNIILISSRIV